ncbi:hypothetical protein MUY27_18425 [Mucilaginibacter sp. RS28]|uniref:Uncharacterized protein n=1 Tax=Mucilaginibacter straminoryzae TaxID=2932774 RepID=A0A9X1X6W4_9SPHI|nr:hypothetical protein [Mucilaginibacter straminoryzae]MCJ8211701.1 hypothetical protein [Mucilaginibacter straminoryzae]
MPTQKEQYDFLKWYLKENPAKKLCDTVKPFDYMVGMDRFFAFRNFGISFEISPKDCLYVLSQVKVYRQVAGLDTSQFKGIDWHLKSDRHLPITYISLPVFSRDRKTVFINRAYHCGGLCGEGGIEIYVKTQGRWKRLDTGYWRSWIS